MGVLALIDVKHLVLVILVERYRLLDKVREILDLFGFILADFVRVGYRLGTERQTLTL